MARANFALTVAFVSLFLVSYGAQAETQILSTLECSALSKKPEKNKKFSTAIPFVLAGNSLRGERSTKKHAGKEVYLGVINANKELRVTGRGAYFNRGPGWYSEFSGPIKEGLEQVTLKGPLTNFNGSRRDCLLTIFAASDKLVALFSPSTTLAATASTKVADAPTQGSNKPQGQEEQTRKQLAALADDLQNKQRALQAAQEELKKQQADAARDYAEKQKALQAAQNIAENNLGEKQKALQAEQEELKRQQAAAANDLNEKQKALRSEQDKLSKANKDLITKQQSLEVEHKTLKQEQTKTAENVNWVQKLLDGIVLPITEDPNAWMMRVAAVPVQQQQFCRIVDQFYDNLDQVYQTRNDIKKNTLFQDRKIRMATLLPRGQFANWVVQIKEVTQASDGSAAVMLQPPCRVMLGSDACQKNGSKIRATIATSSPIYRELGNVNAGDFVVISGKILYAESADEGLPLPTYAVYQAGSHCSTVEGSKHEDVFVTEINYLVQLR